jgi:hypothetical protein
VGAHVQAKRKRRPIAGVESVWGASCAPWFLSGAGALGGRARHVVRRQRRRLPRWSWVAPKQSRKCLRRTKGTAAAQSSAGCSLCSRLLLARSRIYLSHLSIPAITHAYLASRPDLSILAIMHT